MFSQWSHLPVVDVLPLLVKHDITSSAYTIQVTDLTHIWTESLDRRQIIRRAFDENVSIDPSEGPGQLMKLLQEIEKALTGQPDTSLKIEYPTRPESITLKATVILPSPFPLLTWCFRFSSAPQELFTSEFLLPCLSELLRARSNVASLLTHIKDKDHVISRLTEKLEAAGIELTAVFPSAAPSRRSKANAHELVLASVRGLDEFDVKNWRNGVRALTEDTNIEVLYSQVFKTESPAVYDAPNNPLDEHSIYKLAGKSSVMQKSDTIESPQSLIGYKDDDGDFQVSISRRMSTMIVDQLKRQNTPAQESDAAMKPVFTREQVRRAASNSRTSGSETSDDDLEGPVAKTHETMKPVPTLVSEGSRKLGVLGGKGQRGPSVPPQTALGPTESGESKSIEQALGQLEDRTTLPAAINKPRPILGRIGGLQKERRPLEVEAGALRPPPSASMTGNSLSTVVDLGRSRCQSIKKSASPPPARETSQERADRNRARLKRELEEKNKVPAKKKRKF
ncbi:hypothetical protein MMC18_008492 [Xylographa bjoerkii]|nr:hypothetical protein [Xylographa bjoerkii]